MYKESLNWLLLNRNAKVKELEAENEALKKQLENAIVPELTEKYEYFIIHKNEIIMGKWNGEYNCLRNKVMDYTLLFYPPYRKCNGWYSIKEIFKTQAEAQAELERRRLEDE